MCLVCFGTGDACVCVKEPMQLTRVASLRYERTESKLRIQTSGLTNHEIREVMVGLWASLDDDDRADHIAELQHYAANTPGTFFSDIACFIQGAVKRGPMQ